MTTISVSVYAQDITSQNGNNVNASFSNNLSSALLSPEFIDYQDSLKNNTATCLAESQGRAGLVPSPVDLSYLAGKDITNVNGMVGSAQYPPSYDLRTTGKVTSIKNQGSASDCWAFATYASMESTLMPAENDDFSENNLKNTAGLDIDPNTGGGNFFMSTAYLARWGGPVYETDDPYGPNTVASPAGLKVQKHVQDVLFIPPRNGSLDNDNIKWAIMNYGAVYSTICVAGGIGYIPPLNDTFYNTQHNSYYYFLGSSSNHAIAIVGWDDNYSKNNFSTPPPGNGAFIVKNSWGAGWGDDGYFYVSYYDTAIGNKNALFTAEPIIDYNHVYQYDPLGWTNNAGYGFSSDTAWFANQFKANENEKLTAAGFYSPAVNSQYHIYVYVNGALSGTTSGTIGVPGYHTVRLNAPISLNKDDIFKVEVELDTPGYDYPISLEEQIGGYSSNAIANASEGFVSNDGIRWTDITTISGYSNTSVCLKAYTIDAPGTVSGRVTIDNANTGAGGFSVFLVNANNSQEIYYNNTTNAYGNYQFSGVASSGGQPWYRVVAYNDLIGYCYSAPFSVASGANAQINVVMVTQPSRIELSVDRDSIFANGSDNINVTAYIVDALGMPAADGTGIRFSLSSLGQDHGSLGSIYGISPSGDELDVMTTGGSAKIRFGWANVAGTSTITAEYVDNTRVNASIGVQAIDTLHADFTSSIVRGMAPLVVQFNDTSAGQPGSWDWDFGDGTGNATARNASHIFNTAGTYNVTLTVSNEAGSSTLEKTGYIIVTTPDDHTSYTLSLKQGWNLVSSPLAVDQALDVSVFKGTSVTIVARYNRSTGGFDIYRVGKTPRAFPFEAGQGYFLYCNNDTSYIINGYNEPGRSVIVYQGWNLIGWTSMTASNAKSLAAGLHNVTMLAKYNTTTGSYDIYRVGKTPAPFSIIPGEGYFLYMAYADPQTLIMV